MANTVLNILHFNDVYRVSKQNVKGGTIDVAQWAKMLEDRRNEWPLREDGKRDGLVLFSGDVFSPSIESSVTRGSHMVPIMNTIKIDCSVAGNHDFDWSAPHFLKLVAASNYPWLLSNIIDTDTGTVPDGLQSLHVIERSGARIGIVGLVEEDWIQTIPAWPPNYKYQDMQEVAITLSKQLRDPNGEHRCDLIVALTHSRLPNDIELAKALHARVGDSGINEHGCDIVLGGHDHFYYVSRFTSGATWHGYDPHKPFLGAEGDDGVLVIKSGTDFRDLSEIQLELADSPPGSVRKKYISAVKGCRHCTQPNSASSEEISALVKDVLSNIEESLSNPVCTLGVVLDCRSEVVRMAESASGNWFADIIFHAYDDALCLRGEGGADGVLICGGTIRGDSTYGPGEFTVGNIIEILPFHDPVIVLQMEGSTLWAALENALGAWPAQEGRFPAISGFQVKWDSRRPKGQRVISVILRQEHTAGGQETPRIAVEPVSKEPGGRTYNVVTRLYMAEGYDGFEVLKDCKFLIDEANGRIMSDIVRHFLLGFRYIKHMETLPPEETPQHISARSSQIIDASRSKQVNGEAKYGKEKWAEILREKSMKPSRSQLRDYFAVAGSEHMSHVDSVDGAMFRGERSRQESTDIVIKNDMVTMSPRTDGRLKDIGREA